ncbi:tumor necrosis factor receptor superfamily member 14 isoform X3 [Oncorhynchus mykiss]|uniref:tumor necrosis factor receptor superfamily member 14 isoform X3 n=1 Tax=Oncorhynchus mykiss TaxID=8022 RepID=UPI0018784FAE|nr:tumor necrosis factor receptor superfamily member 14 isoform X3 [Oncorhynchus mykiss]
MAQFESLIWTIPIILVLESIGSCIACGRAEYRIRDECCPMCSPGNRVHRHCTEFTSTSCVPCVDSTFLDEPNGLIKCKVCTNCDPGLGLKVKQPCTPSSDTVCGTLEGFYCLDPTKDGCRAAQRHSGCEPGQYISHTAGVCLFMRRRKMVRTRQNIAHQIPTQASPDQEISMLPGGNDSSPRHSQGVNVV